MRYRYRASLLLGMVASAAAAATARLLNAPWFWNLSGWHGYVIETFARQVSAALLALPLIFFIADLLVAMQVPTEKRWKGFWLVVLAAYAVTLFLCNSAFCSPSRPESKSVMPSSQFRTTVHVVLAIALVVAALPLLNCAAFNYWAAGGPPTPDPEVFKTRGDLFAGLSAVLLIGAAIVVWSLFFQRSRQD